MRILPSPSPSGKPQTTKPCEREPTAASPPPLRSLTGHRGRTQLLATAPQRHDGDRRRCNGRREGGAPGPSRRPRRRRLRRPRRLPRRRVLALRRRPRRARRPPAFRSVRSPTAPALAPCHFPRALVCAVWSRAPAYRGRLVRLCETPDLGFAFGLVGWSPLMFRVSYLWGNARNFTKY